jgi:chromatin remodeling complex protein RSC6
MALFRKKKKTVRRRTKKRKAKRKTRKKKSFGGYRIRPDAKLGAIVGNKPVTPAEMTKKIWQYIKRHKLGSKG